ncbi:hypothetical protein RRG08_052454 [Elysia crispata]|uniref:Uncharacterized protein n=1 Tax=Elysia crispata TaxID=231223 RepID=A0AAE1B1B2_9GAST|nr:hypothetical protein RRG08_052454 [Elysia crispata]
MRIFFGSSALPLHNGRCFLNLAQLTVDLSPLTILSPEMRLRPRKKPRGDTVTHQSEKSGLHVISSLFPAIYPIP